MKVIIGKPPIYDEAVKAFSLDEKGPILFTYGDTCYNPNGANITADLIRHEETHMEQQGHDNFVASIWWQRYFADKEFRTEQEIEAYGEQYKFISNRVKDRNKRSRFLWEIATHLSGPMYGRCISHSEAMKRVRDYAEGNDLVDIEQHIKDESGVEL